MSFFATILQREKILINHYCFILLYAVIIVVLRFQKKQIITNINTIFELEFFKCLFNTLVRILFLCNINQLLIYILDFIFVNKVSSNNVIFIKFLSIIIIIIGMLLAIHIFLKYFLEIDYFMLLGVVIIIYLAGWLENRTWEFIALIAVVANMLLNYDDAQLIYVDITNKLCPHINFYKSKKEHEIKFFYLKLKFNIALIFLYLYIQFSDNINILGNKLGLLYGGEGKLDDFMKVFIKGSDRIFGFLIIIIILVLLLKCKLVKNGVNKIIEKIKINYKNAFERMIK